MHLPQERVQRVGRLLVEVSSRLVGQQDRRAHDEGARHGDTLLLAARQHPRFVREPLFEADAPQQRFGPRPSLSHRHPRDAQRHLGVLERIELRQQVMELEHEADVAIAECHHLRIRQHRQVDAVDRNRALIDAIETAEHVEQRAFSHA